MKYAKFVCSNGYGGCKSVTYVAYDTLNKDFLDEYLVELALENAENHLEVISDEYGSYDYEKILEKYFENAVDYSYWVYITKEEFDNYKGD